PSGRPAPHGCPGAAAPRRPPGPLATAILAVAFGFGCLLFLPLGLWQAQRMGWKHALIARVDARVQADPAPAPDAAAWRASTPLDHEYRRVTVRGHWLPGRDARVQALTEAGAGRWLLRPLRRDDRSEERRVGS